jgi:hypothetical protein
MRMVNNMHDFALNKFDKDEKPFAKSMAMAIYFEHIYPIKDKGIFALKPGPVRLTFMQVNSVVVLTIAFYGIKLVGMIAMLM